MPSQFAFCPCQPGAETALKEEVAARITGWRFAFSRPGFVTFRLPNETTADRFEPPKLTFARTIGLSFERLTLESEASEGSARELADLVWKQEEVAQLIAKQPVALHVWQRDTSLPGTNDIEPGPTPLSVAALEVLTATAPEGALQRVSGGESPDDANDKKSRHRVAIDVAMIEPNEWWVGAHTIRSRTDRWPGGVPRIVLPEHAVSRAYLKMQEGLRWSALPCRSGDRWIELGCAPGGASQALLDSGMSVVGIDPAEVDPILLTNSRFRHVARRSAETSFEELTGAQWLAADLNVAPSYTLEAVEEIVKHASTRLRGLLLTLKVLDPKLVKPERIAEIIKRIRSWGYADVRARQLAFNRNEICLAALRTRGQRRLSRSKARTRRNESSN